MRKGSEAAASKQVLETIPSGTEGRKKKKKSQPQLYVPRVFVVGSYNYGGGRTCGGVCSR